MEESYVLIVEDNPDSQEILGTVLRQMGCEIGIANDGIEALESIGQRAPDLVLLDLMMPRMNGFQVLHRMQSHPEMRHIPVILLSAVGSEELLELPGASMVIRKADFSLAEMQTRIQSLLAQALDLPAKRDNSNLESPL